MDIHFYKYQGTGNDFVLIDNRRQFFPKQTDIIKNMCDRRFGIGADGLILLENDVNSDFKMVYYNSDGNESSMCGNGGRCIVAFAKKLEIFQTETTFIAVDGLHFATITNDGIVSLQMKDVDEVVVKEDFVFMNTGSPHHVELVTNLEDINVVEKGRALRYNHYGPLGANINFVSKIAEDTFGVRTYERGVEDETLSCGTGVTAVALAMFDTNQTTLTKLHLKTTGGDLSVCFDKKDQTFTNIALSGPAIQVFKGVWEV